jgi:hypothetical protein
VSAVCFLRAGWNKSSGDLGIDDLSIDLDIDDWIIDAMVSMHRWIDIPIDGHIINRKITR